MTLRLLIVDRERELRVWLRQHLEILWPEAAIEDLDRAQFEPRQAPVTRRQFDLVVFGMSLGTDSQAPQEFLVLSHLLRQRSCPPVVIIANGGNELSAMRAVRLGAADYLPRGLLNPGLLGTSLRGALRRARRQRRRMAPRDLPSRGAQPPTAGSSSGYSVTRRQSTDTPELPQYSILQQLGASSHATVYLAYSAALEHNVALKISNPVIDSQQERRQFAREYAAISALRHPAVVDIYDYGIHGGREFIAMEYFPCGDLKARLRQRLTAAESLDYTGRICAALQVVHAAGLLHRDLKPANIMLRQDGAVVLIDFGLAKHIGSSTQSTAVGVLHGSPYYMSPEQAQGLPLDQRSDLYSLGVILFEMFAGRRPYRGATAVEVMHLHVHGPRPPLPPELSCYEALLEGFMARAREQRFADAATALRALEAPESVGLVPASTNAREARAHGGAG